MTRRKLGGPRGAKTLDQRLIDIAMMSGTDVPGVSRRLESLRKEHGDAVYSGFLHLISHLDFPPPQARRHWESILRHTDLLSEALGRAIDFRVGLADYFIHKKPKIPHPKVIDMRLFQETEAGNLKDGLTGLYNFRYLEEALPRELGKTRRIGAPLSLIFLDVDDFKAYNDKFGHNAGNEVLLRLSAVIREAIRDMDLPCRFGGEEFTVLLPATDKFGAVTVAERIVGHMEDLAIPGPVPPRVVTVSAGVASFPADTDSEPGLIKAADAAMYHAKNQGKNRVVAFKKERRAFERKRGEFQATCTISSSFIVNVDGRDLSQNGLYFISPKDLAKGTNVSLTLRLAQDKKAQEVACRARVVRCEIIGTETYGIGAAITHVEPHDRLRFFQAVATS